MICESKNLEGLDPWWKFKKAIDQFNKIRMMQVVSSYEKVLDESMSSWRPRTTATGGLPNISFILRKPEPLGTELKTVCCAKTGVMTYMEIMRGAKGMKEMPLQKELDGTAACNVRISMGSK